MFMKIQISTANAPVPGGKYSQAINANGFVFLSGQLPMDTVTQSIEKDDPVRMYRLCFQNLQAVCQAAGGDLDDIVKLNVYYVDMHYSSFLDQVIPEFFNEPYPARIRLVVKELSRGAKVEIDAIMYNRPSGVTV
jgi:2-iminobutanoate/2-iminopropanoate deaminase